MKTDHIKYFLELNQVGLLDDNDPSLWAHSDPASKKMTESEVSTVQLYVQYMCSRKIIAQNSYNTEVITFGPLLRKTLNTFTPRSDQP